MEAPETGAGDVRHLGPGCAPSPSGIGSVLPEDGVHPRRGYIDRFLPMLQRVWKGSAA